MSVMKCVCVYESVCVEGVARVWVLGTGISGEEGGAHLFSPQEHTLCVG